MQEEAVSRTDSLQYLGLAQQHGEPGPMQVLPCGSEHLLAKVTEKIGCKKRLELVSPKPLSYCQLQEDNH